MPEIIDTTVATCGHCRNHTQLNVVERFKRYDNSDEAFDPWFEFFDTLECVSCNGISFRRTAGPQDVDPDRTSTSMLYPSFGESSTEGLPDAVATSWTSALAVERVEPAAFAVLTRRTLEALALDRGAQGRSLHDQLKWLASQGQMPDTLSDMANGVRALGNVGAHYSPSENVTTDDVQVIREFAEAIFEYIYRAPAKVAQLQARLRRSP